MVTVYKAICLADAVDVVDAVISHTLLKVAAVSLTDGDFSCIHVRNENGRTAKQRSQSKLPVATERSIRQQIKFLAARFYYLHPSRMFIFTKKKHWIVNTRLVLVTFGIRHVRHILFRHQKVKCLNFDSILCMGLPVKLLLNAGSRINAGSLIDAGVLRPVF